MNIFRFTTKLCLIYFAVLINFSRLEAQEEFFSYCQKVPPWEDFVFDSILAKDKSMLLVVTNRPYLPEQKEFLKNDIEHLRLVSYFLAYCESEKWHLTLLDSLEQGLNIINKGEDLLLFIHGHGKTFPESISRSNLIKQRYNVGMILFDWPSKNKDFNYSQARVRHCSENFYNLTLQLKSYRERSMQSNQHLSLFAHSLGNYFLVQLVLNGNNQYYKDVFFDNIIINAAAIKTEDHSKVLSHLKIQKQLYIVLNENDKAIRGAQLLNFGKMLGNYALPPLVPHAEYIHFTGISGKQHTNFAGFHHFEYDNPAVFDFYNAVIHGLNPDLDNSEYYIKRSGGDGYDIAPLTIEKGK